ncbi:hypothetical protein HYE67_000514 [Fusarium culmorum]|uniref:Uncharacterized protein n=1 Tax=Fusarium culmorum TaxID=5516 RepID=A0A2T4GNM3_FUSCU|nr:hypothetical protein FCULG_00002131 [Fusarium culmorum]QPC58283.1 hypothetical protein HYE67_000514 [Fusarium culmorum]
MRLYRSLNPDRKSKRELDRNLLYSTLIDDVTPTKTSKKRAERERNSRNRPPRRRIAQPRPNQLLKPPGHHLHTDQVGLLVEPDNRPGDFRDINHNTSIPGSFAETPESVALLLNSHYPNSTFTAEATDIGASGVDEGGLMIESPPTVYQTNPNIPSAFQDLFFSSSGDLWNNFGPQDMTPTELHRHMEETAREVQRRAAPPPTLDPNPDQEVFSAMLTFGNGHTSREIVCLDEGFEVNFVSQGYLNKLRTTSGKPLCLVPAPPIYREVFTPDGIWAPVRYLLYADLEWESPDIPFPPRQLCFIHYSGNGGVHDNKLILGQSWFNSTEDQAPNRP